VDAIGSEQCCQGSCSSLSIGDWDEHVHFDWRRIRDNIDWLRPETIRKINELIVAAGHKLVPKAAESVRTEGCISSGGKPCNKRRRQEKGADRRFQGQLKVVVQRSD
jgi:hypothetical protein